MGELAIPRKLAATVVAWEGDQGRAWLGRLPTLVAEVAERWDLEVGPPLEPGGNISWVAPARRRHGGVDAVLKVQLPHPETAPEAAGLQAWDGDGAVRLLAHDAERWALLLERCRPGHGLDAEGGTTATVAAGAAVGAQLHAVPPPPGLPALATVMATWADELEGRLAAHPALDPGLGRRAVATMREAPAASPDRVLLHGDLNPTNVLAAERAPWLAIDPKPMVGDPARDGARLVLQPDPTETAAPASTLAQRLAVVADVMGVDRDGLVEWCLADAVEIGASARSHGDPDLGDRCDRQVSLLAPLLR